MKAEIRRLEEKMAADAKRHRYELRRLATANARLREALIAKALISRDDLISKPLDRIK